MPKLTIDGESIEVPQGTTLLQAALARGNEVPHYCYHPGLSIAGNCRMCLVELEKAPKLVIACQTEAADGMVVHTRNARVKEAQAAVMEFLLINHPLDCPICDQAGECRLQEYAVEHGTGVSRYTEPKLAQAKAIDIGRHILLDQERCIHCSRCIRFCDEVTETGELAFFQRGNRSMIGIYPGRRLDNAYSGNVADLCPVGALTLKEFRFQTRVWYLQNTPTVCAGCARGCNVLVAVGNQQQTMTFAGQLDDGIKRIVPRFNEEVNGHWICDEGRLSHQPMEAAERLRSARGGETEIDWDDAVAQAAERLRTAAQAGRAAAIFSPRLTSETLFAWKQLLSAVGQVRIGVTSLHRGEDDGLLIRADKGANSKGAGWILGDAPVQAVLDAARTGEIDTLVVVGDVLDPADTAAIDDETRKRIEHLIYVGPFLDGAAQSASLLLPAAAWSEEEGSLVNFEGRVQRVRRCRRPRGEGREGWRVALALAGAMEIELPEWSSAAGVLASLGQLVEAFGDLDGEKIGLLGVKGAR